MITTGIITAINVSDNGDNNVNYLYNVEIALFQTPGDKNKDNYTYTAAACVPSSINSPFSVGDKVFIGFLCNEISVPIILGKIYAAFTHFPFGIPTVTDTQYQNSRTT